MQNRLKTIFNHFFNTYVRLEKIRAGCSASILCEGTKEILRIFKLKRIIVYTRDFVLSLLNPAYGITPETEQYALLFGAAVAATRAFTGRFGA
jgi:ADP-dependent phosphofructokinase/glucokinase